jgi:hypothetical protein
VGEARTAHLVGGLLLANDNFFLVHGLKIYEKYLRRVLMEIKKRFHFPRNTFVPVGMMVCLVFLWWTAGFPRSLLEYSFLSALKSITSSKVEEVSLSSLMPTDWETVCVSHGYDDDLYLAKYNKKFPTAGPLQDGYWRLTFIQPDGTYNQVSSWCSRGSYFRFSGRGCLTRDKSTLHRMPMNEIGKCVSFQEAQ